MFPLYCVHHIQSFSTNPNKRFFACSFCAYYTVLYVTNKTMSTYTRTYKKSLIDSVCHNVWHSLRKTALLVRRVSPPTEIFPICALQRKSNVCIPRKGIAPPQSQSPHSGVCERFIYSQTRSTYFPATE